MWRFSIPFVGGITAVFTEEEMKQHHATFLIKCNSVKTQVAKQTKHYVREGQIAILTKGEKAGSQLFNYCHNRLIPLIMDSAVDACKEYL